MRVNSILAQLAIVTILVSVVSCAFPKDFAWGTATASYQIEGAWNVSGKGENIWDVFSHIPGKVRNNDNGDVADDSYHRFREDVQLMKNAGFKWARLSLSWARILPTGRLPVNPDGIRFYNEFIDAIIEAGLKPFVTLYHWDLPQALNEPPLNGWLDRSIVDDFVTYGDVCFEHFGDRVGHWLTFNEPISFVNLGYMSGIHAPGRCSDRSRCPEGNSDTEPFIAGHHVLLAHAKTVQVYRQKYQKKHHGLIGITNPADWAEPHNPNSSADIAAAQRFRDYQLGWWCDPVYYGDYPASMKAGLGNLLPAFTPEEKALLKGSQDFFGLNHYTSGYMTYTPHPDPSNPAWVRTMRTSVLRERDGKPIGPRAESDWLYVVPWGFQKLLEYVSHKYPNLDIWVTENGVSVPNENNLPIHEAVEDTFRVNYYQGYIEAMSKAIANGARVKGYFAWSLLDNFEWADGYGVRFGLHYVDYTNGQKRYAKSSAKWFKKFITAQEALSQDE